MTKKVLLFIEAICVEDPGKLTPRYIFSQFRQKLHQQRIILRPLVDLSVCILTCDAGNFTITRDDVDRSFLDILKKDSNGTYQFSTEHSLRLNFYTPNTIQVKWEKSPDEHIDYFEISVRNLSATENENNGNTILLTNIKGRGLWSLNRFIVGSF